ncbi:MAG TPA: pantoate--beta-alanine ligase [Dehalococcoidia bacterium]|nr:pantoate--beta-alanine ligase [Dehalococcoidia bacterium]
MQVVSTIDGMRRLRYQTNGRKVGFVPTMGYLHEGHLSLVRKARAENDLVVVSIFVNPIQFGPNEDFEKYPRDTQRDLSLLQQENVDIVFMPSALDVYPEGFNAYVDVGQVTEVLEGAFRPGHFRGVATVVLKLFNAVQPHRAYFGQKDAQQVVVIRKMVQDLNVGVEIVGCPTIRETGGLAMSSRNVFLSPDERRAALVLFRCLSLVERLHRQGERDAGKLRGRLEGLVAREPLAHVDYISIADPHTLQELETIEGPALISLAIRIGVTRLIDNLTVGEKRPAIVLDQPAGK